MSWFQLQLCSRIRTTSTAQDGVFCSYGWWEELTCEPYSFVASAAPTDAPIPQGRSIVSPLPRESTKLVMRVTNPEAMLNEKVRVQGEAIMMRLMGKALAGLNDEGNIAVMYG